MLIHNKRTYSELRAPTSHILSACPAEYIVCHPRPSDNHWLLLLDTLPLPLQRSRGTGPLAESQCGGCLQNHQSSKFRGPPVCTSESRPRMPTPWHLCAWLETAPLLQ